MATELKGRVVVDSSRLNELLKLYVARSHFVCQEAIRYQAARLGLELFSRWRKVVTPQKIEAEMRASIGAGKGFKRDKKKITLGLKRSNLLGKELIAGGLAFRNDKGRWKLRKGKRGEFQAAVFRAELRRRIGKIGFQAAGWLAAYFKFGNKTRTVRVRRAGESWADASAVKTAAKNVSHLGRVNEGGSGATYHVYLINYADGVDRTEAKHNIVQPAITARMVDLADHIGVSLTAAAKDVGFKVA